ncbi:hypothetical protein DFJ58DRAFT_722600 [Suillus subalutaceus]|uniref:uncharacterized protein n=1 Tax=Suillus subalutaceus TaxID=48586 RepID=UPI001B88464A|nr:uncharacterized protein DFJ58DRAFT_722600 [Suillus subalutaceus]KAG1871848.1 hypothetical protein DFJ58DRAFT_722600 [Suillus subalutaceus]KAG1879863.1 hypothetical protein F4604DRAFT_1752116 [Suillus subluteus]
MPFSTDGVYHIRNTGRNLMLDLTGNRTTEGNQIQGYTPNDSTAQQWVIKRQNEPGSANMTVSIQSNNEGNNGNGCFATASEDSDEPVIYTRQAFLINLVGRADNTFTMCYTLGNKDLVLSIPSAKDGAVKLENYEKSSARQQWELTRVSNLQPIGN